MKWEGRHGNGAVSLIENSALSELLLLNICVHFNPPPNPTPPPRPNPPPPAPRRFSLQPPQAKLSSHVPSMDVSHAITCVCTKGCRCRAQPDTSSQGRVCCVQFQSDMLLFAHRNFGTTTTTTKSSFLMSVVQNFFFRIKSLGTCLLDNPQLRNVADASSGGNSLEAGKVQHDPLYY